MNNSMKRTEKIRKENTETASALLQGSEISETNYHGLRYVKREGSYFNAPRFTPREYAAVAEAINALNDYAGDDANVNYQTAGLAVAMQDRARGALLCNPQRNAELVLEAIAKAK
jgi:hypothetical protein